MDNFEQIIVSNDFFKYNIRTKKNLSSKLVWYIYFANWSCLSCKIVK